VAILRKISYFFFWFIALLLSAVVAVLLALNLSYSFQEYVGEQVSKSVSKQTGLTVKIKRFRIAPPLNLSIDNIYIEDFEGRKILKSNYLDVDLSTFRLTSSKFYFNEITSDSLELNLVKSAQDSVWNYQLLLSELERNLPASDGKTSLYLWFDLVKFKYIQINKTDLKKQDYFLANDLSFENSFWEQGNLKLNFSVQDYADSYRSKVDRLSAVFVQKDSVYAVSNLVLDNKRSKLKVDDLSFVQFSDSAQSQIKLDMPQLVLSQVDFPVLKQYLGTVGRISASASVSGSLSQMQLKNLDVSFGVGSKISLKGSVTDVLDVNSSFADVYVEDSYFKTSDLLKLKWLGGVNDDGKQIISNLESVKFTGELVGFLSDFVAYGKFETPFGALETDLALRSGSNLPTFSGSLKSVDFGVGNLLNSNKLGSLGLSLDVNGSGSNSKNITAKAKGDLAFVEINGERLENVSIDAELKPEYFNGFIGLEDSVTFIAAVGEIDFSKKIPEYRLNLDLQEKDIRRFIDSSAVKLGINLSAELNGKGFDYETIDAEFVISSLQFTDSASVQSFNNTILSVYNSPLGKELRLSSNFINASVSGDLDPKLLKNSLLSLMPKTPWTTSEYAGLQDFYFTINIDNNYPIQWLSKGDLFLANGSYLSGSWRSTSSDYSLILQSDSVSYEGVQIDKANFFLETKNDIFSADIYAAKLSRGNLYLNEVQVNLNYAEEGKWTVNAYNGFNNYFEAVGSYSHNADSMEVEIANVEGKLVGKHVSSLGQGRIYADTTVIRASDFKLSIENKPFMVDGAYNFKQGVERLDLLAYDFDLAYLNQLGLNDPILGGVGNIVVNVDSVKQIEAKLNFKNITISEKLFGNLDATTYYDYSTSDVKFDVSLGKYNEYKRNELFTAKGSYQIDSGEMDGRVKFIDYNIRKIDRMFTEEVRDIKGLLNGNLDLKGTFKNIQLDGELSLSNAKVHVDYLNADFIIPSALVKIRPDFIGLDHINVTDVRGNKGYITGTGFHTNFNDWNFDVVLEANDFKLLNTSKYDNSLFYGTGNVSGWVNASGYGDKLFFEMNVTPERGSKMYIPMTDDTEVNDQEFVEFVKPEGADTNEVEEENSWLGIDLDLTVNANNNAEVFVVFDEAAGDIMSARGSGVLNFKIDQFGDLDARGKYIIEDGEYLFTLENVINKKFNIRNGSSIFWYGDPYKAILDVTAEYKLRVPLRDIVLIENERYNRREQVVAILKLENELFNPDINFDIYLPNTDDLTRTQVKSVLRTQDEINRQVFSLLVFNRFSAPNTKQANAFNDAGTTTTTELLSNQLSNWFSQISSDFDIGFSYSGNKSSSTESQTTELTNRQVAFALSTQLFNERLTLSTNLGVDQTTIDASTTPSNRFISDFALEYSLTKDGRFKLKAFNETAQGLYLSNNLSNYIQGVGVYYRKDFNSFSEAWQNVTKRLRIKKEE
jgi:hypothetical protein